MNRSAKIHRHLLVSLTLAWIAAAWVGCAKSADENDADSSNTSTATSGTGGSGGAGGGEGGEGGINFDGGDGSVDDGACVTTSAEAHRVPLDMIFLIDRSGSMSGPKWIGTKNALSTFFNDPASAGIGAGLEYFPAQLPNFCNVTDYALLDVPIDLLPGHAFALTNSMPFDALGAGTPMYIALKGTLMGATAYQDAHPTHKVVVVLATDGEPGGCMGDTIENVQLMAANALSYNGVRTYVIGVAGSIITNLNKVAAAGGTVKAYDITQNINEFAAKMAEIRQVALGCDFELPAPPGGQELDADKVNFTYMPHGVGSPKIVPRADDLADCNDQPGWYYDKNNGPTKIVLCPASCATVQADSDAKVSVLFGCKSIIN